MKNLGFKTRDSLKRRRLFRDIKKNIISKTVSEVNDLLVKNQNLSEEVLKVFSNLIEAITILTNFQNLNSKNSNKSPSINPHRNKKNRT